MLDVACVLLDITINKKLAWFSMCTSLTGIRLY